MAVDEFQIYVYENGAYWGIALVAVIISKLYTEDEEQSVKTVVRSFVAAGLYTYLAVHYGLTHGYSAPTLSLGVFFGAFLIDVIVALLVHVKTRITNNPGGTISWFSNFWGKDK